MIIVHLSGGLGNQMFQYATGRALAIRNNDTLKVDISSFGKSEKETLRTYKLNNFNIKTEVASQDEIRELSNTNLLKRVINRLGGYWGPFIVEKTRGFDKRVLKLHGNLYLYGYWQSEKYFLKYRKIILNDFELKVDVSKKHGSILKEIENSTSVSLHIRRGDYTSSPIAAARLGFCGLDYYVRASRYIETKMANPKYYVFSDDMDWVIKNLKLNYPVKFIERGEDYEEMYLMSCCRHNITANSSYSWWGAWLNKSKDKIVICPKKWFNDGGSSDSLVPNGWVKL